MLVLYFSFYHFDDFLTAFAEDFMKKQPVFIMNIKSSDKFLVSHINLRSRNLSQWNDSPKNLVKFARKRIFSCNFCKV